MNNITLQGFSNTPLVKPDNTNGNVYFSSLPNTNLERSPQNDMYNQTSNKKNQVLKVATFGLILTGAALLIPKARKKIFEFLKPNKAADNIENIVKKIENNYVKSDIENLVIIDSKTGKKLLEKPGTATEVRLTGEQEKLLEGNIFTHNHPRYDTPELQKNLQGVHFHPINTPDVETAVKYGASEVRAFNERYRYSISVPKYKPEDRKGIIKTMNDLFEKKSKELIEINNTYAQNPELFNKIMNERGLNNTEDLIIDNIHKSWEYVCNKLGWKFKIEQFSK